MRLPIKPLIRTPAKKQQQHSNSRQALKTLRAEGYVGRDRELSRQLAKDVAQVFDYAAGRTNELPTVFK